MDTKTVFEPHIELKNSPLGPQKVKNNSKIKSKSNSRIEKKTKKIKVVQLHEWTPKQLSNPTLTPKVAQ